jgi:hypothetical protein
MTYSNLVRLIVILSIEQYQQYISQFINQNSFTTLTHNPTPNYQKEIQKVTHLCFIKITVEPYPGRTMPPQCQQFFHVVANCQATARRNITRGNAKRDSSQTLCRPAQDWGVRLKVQMDRVTAFHQQFTKAERMTALHLQFINS